MKKIIVILSVFLMSSSLCAQPAAFSWFSRHENFNYISTAKDQEEQGPCRIFASVAAVEAMAQIYFNKNGAALNLSESNIYNGGYGCPGFGCSIGSASVEESLGLIKSSGIVDENCFPYPTQPEYCRTDCDNICDNPANLVTIPKYLKINPGNNTELKQAIMDYGPIIAVIAGTKNGYNVGCELHPGGNCNYSHTVLIVGWKSSPSFQWDIKDSWPNDAKIFYSSVDIFSYKKPAPMFYMIHPVYNGNTISCSGSDCSIFNNRSYEDHDGDGFYNWGLDLSSKPAGCSGPDKMDFDDDDADHIFFKRV
jgi:hypothetical protein